MIVIDDHVPPQIHDRCDCVVGAVPVSVAFGGMFMDRIEEGQTMADQTHQFSHIVLQAANGNAT